MAKEVPVIYVNMGLYAVNTRDTNDLKKRFYLLPILYAKFGRTFTASRQSLADACGVSLKTFSKFLQEHRGITIDVEQNCHADGADAASTYTIYEYFIPRVKNGQD